MKFCIQLPVETIYVPARWSCVRILLLGAENYGFSGAKYVSSLILYGTVLNTGGRGFEILQKFWQAPDSNHQTFGCQSDILPLPHRELKSLILVAIYIDSTLSGLM